MQSIMNKKYTCPSHTKCYIYIKPKQIVFLTLFPEICITSILLGACHSRNNVKANWLMYVDCFANIMLCCRKDVSTIYLLRSSSILRCCKVSYNKRCILIPYWNCQSLCTCNTRKTKASNTTCAWIFLSNDVHQHKRCWLCAAATLDSQVLGS